MFKTVKTLASLLNSSFTTYQGKLNNVSTTNTNNQQQKSTKEKKPYICNKIYLWSECYYLNKIKQNSG